jgi:hypothetical protein
MKAAQKGECRMPFKWRKRRRRIEEFTQKRPKMP